MALQSVQHQSKQPRETLRTQATTFNDCPVHPDGLFEVRGDQSAQYALSVAMCLAGSIKCLAQEGVDHGLDSEICYLVAFTAEAMEALVQSVQGTVEHVEFGNGGAP